MTTAIPPRRHRLAFRLAVVLAVLVTAAGTAVAIRGYAATAGPDGAVRGYLDALRDGDAATALAYGDVPDGPRDLLTSTVLRAQQDLAPIQDVSVRTSSERGDRARVEARYTLGFAGAPTEVAATLGVHRTDGEWRLDAVAVATQLQLLQADQRATLGGERLPAGTALVFPGAVPVSFDTPYLRVRPSQDHVDPDAGATTQMAVEPSPAGTSAAIVAVRNALLACLRGSADPRCPQPTERYVPGSVRGALAAPLTDDLTVDVGDSARGVLEISGEAVVKGGYTRLEFDNTRTVRTGATIRLPIDARAYAVAPLALQWERPS